MLDSFFVITDKGEILIERHFTKKIPRSTAEKFYELALKFSSFSDVSPVICLANDYYLTHIYRDNLFFLGINRCDMEPLTVTNFLEELYKIFLSYLMKVNENTIKGGFVIIYQLLDEIIDNGFTLTTELTLLNDLVKPPVRLFKKLNFTRKEGTGRSIVPWRKMGLKYSTNEFFFDVEEELTCLININSSPSISEINGKIKANCFLSGMPDILLQFNDPSIFKHVLFHPCVRYSKYEEDRSISFIPPDGHFTLLEYKVGNIANLPLYCRAQINYYQSGGNISIILGPKHKEGVLENVYVEFPIPYPLQLLKKLNCTVGHAAYIAKEKKFRWDIGKLTTSMKNCTCTGQIYFSRPKEGKLIAPPAVEVKFKLDKVAFSGLKIERVEILREKYKTFKGVKYYTRNGKYEIRTV